MSIVGKIEQWDERKGYGFISVDRQAPRILFHLSDLSGYSQKPRLNERVHFTLAKDAHGSFVAKHIERPMVFGFPIAVMVWFVTILASSVWLIEYPAVSLLYYALVSTVTYVFYLYDSSAMVDGQTRVPELLLHLLAIMGGWIGATIAQGTLRREPSSFSYQWGFWISVAINISVYAWTFTPEGEKTLHEWISALQLSVS
ncbi:DUF1294 domain-containing protein [Vibrio sp. 10N.261.55.A7]|uniref:DUF1294 domain-containing protein n=1 Tax=Vibrio sp. 10N.261.55.A7 TaxID=1880851 RepID=UPI000C850FDB|nr:DUF1294 domain-containing protein [Vibrio sp. 10N.261.55.A7]PMJ97612.1 hypothetical protein BCU12_04530 [Vibrio sp. 10N.261.55.A7]